MAKRAMAISGGWIGGRFARAAFVVGVAAKEET